MEFQQNCERESFICTSLFSNLPEKVIIHEDHSSDEFIIYNNYLQSRCFSLNKSTEVLPCILLNILLPYYCSVSAGALTLPGRGNLVITQALPGLLILHVDRSVLVC